MKKTTDNLFARRRKQSKKVTHGLDQPLLHHDHPRPKSRRDFLRQGFYTGAASVLAPSLGSMLSSRAHALVSDEEFSECGISGAGNGMIPFICFDLAGGANLAGSIIMVGKQGGQDDFFYAGGYTRRGVLAEEMPSLITLNQRLGLQFHPTSSMLAGINETFTNTTGIVDGIAIPARSENDTANNPHNPLYAIARAGITGSILPLVGSRSSDSGGNSMAPMDLINLEIRPTKIDRASDARGVVDSGKLFELLDATTAQRVIESMYRFSALKTAQLTGVDGIPSAPATGANAVKRTLDCSYRRAVNNSSFRPELLDPEVDTDIFNSTGGIFAGDSDRNDREFAKTAAVMKLVIDGYAGAGCIAMGGYDYHTGNRTTGDSRDVRAGKCIGACLEYAARRGSPLAVYVYSDGSVFSNGMMDPNNGRLVWTGDNSSTACSFMLVYHPNGGIQVLRNAGDRQLGWYRANGSVDTNSSLCADNVESLVDTVALNYLALHNLEGNYSSLFPNNGLGSASSMDQLIKFNGIVTLY